MQISIANNTRLHYIDHLRGFIFLLMATDHALHAYAQNWGHFWFYRDSERSIICDALYMNNQSIIMPMLFFIVGMFTIHSLRHRGFFGYIKERFIRLGLPFIIFIPITVPLLSYPRSLTYTNPDMSLSDFYVLFFTERIQAGPLWVMQAMFFFGLTLAALVTLIPPLWRMVKWSVNIGYRYPILGLPSFIIKIALFAFIGDMIWGAPWWFSLSSLLHLNPETSPVLSQILRLFSLQGSRFLVMILFFLTGAALHDLGYLKRDHPFMQRLERSWLVWAVLAVGFAVIYTSYSLDNFHEGAFDESTREYLSTSNWTWSGLWYVITQTSGMVFIRTTLQGFLVTFQALALLAIFARYVNTPNRFWHSLAGNTYGIFLLHETFMVWLQYSLNGVNLPIILKFMIVFFIGFPLAWFINDRFLLRVPIFKRVLSPDYIPFR
jgi:hypothetical protein